jgi:hypothetical protein
MKRALLCGLNYIGSDSELNGCINDVNNVNNFLKTRGYTDIKILTDLTEIKPTRSNMESAIAWLVNDVKTGDTLFFHYSGHGTTVKDTSGDESDGRDSVLVPLDCDEAGPITDDWLYSNLTSILPEGVTLWVLMDCCHSGTMLDLEFNIQYKSVYTPPSKDDVSKSAKTKKIPKGIPYVSSMWSNQFAFVKENSKPTSADVFMFSGCWDNDTSADATIRNESQGAFTACFLEFIALNPNYSSKRLIEMLKEINCRLTINGFSQRSQLSIGQIQDINQTFNP